MSHFVFANPKLCIGCDTCLAACAEAHLAAGENPQPRLVIVRSVKASVPMTCRQCDNAPCVAVCPVNALKISNNAVTIDESMCNGCQLCVPACPFGVMTFSDGADDHPKGVIQQATSRLNLRNIRQPRSRSSATAILPKMAQSV
jgi:Fe-S-cluster-containing hydrogenase component 2